MHLILLCLHFQLISQTVLSTDGRVTFIIFKFISRVESPNFSLSGFEINFKGIRVAVVVIKPQAQVFRLEGNFHSSVPTLGIVGKPEVWFIGEASRGDKLSII